MAVKVIRATNANRANDVWTIASCNLGRECIATRIIWDNFQDSLNAILGGVEGIHNSLLSIIFPYIAIGIPLSIFLFTGFFRNLPDALIESARLEGASNLKILSRIVVPLSKPVIGANLIFQFMFIGMIKSKRPTGI